MLTTSLELSNVEFKGIPNPNLYTYTCSQQVANLYTEATKYRYLLRWYNARPYNHNRIAIIDCGPSDFIDASPVKVDNNDSTIIVSSAPIPIAFYSWWMLIFQEKITDIYCLTRIAEKGITKMDQYWPDDGQIIDYKIFTISKMGTGSEYLFDDLIKIPLVINWVNKEPYHVNLYIYTGWPDFGVPNSTSKVEFIVEQIIGGFGFNRKPLVHCSAGLGRSGVITAAVRCLLTGEDAATAVQKLRNDRAGMVQTSEQYHLIKKLQINLANI